MVNFRDSIGLLAYTSSNDVQIAGGVWSENRIPNNDGGVSNVAQAVLEFFEVPIQGTIPVGTRTGLPGYDINNFDAVSALKIGLASYLADEKLVDIFINGDGFAEFVVVAEGGGFSPNPPILLDVRSCIPTYTFEEKANVVIVTGYDPPPERIIRPGKAIVPAGKAVAGTATKPQDVADSDCMILTDSIAYGDTADRRSCDNSTFETVATVSYRDPVLDTAYDDQAARNGRAFYDLGAFENLVGYIIDFDTGHDELHVSYQNSTTTPVKYRENLPTLVGTETVCALLGDGTGSEYATFKTATIPVNSVKTRDRYGDDNRDIFLGVQAIEAVGHTIQNFTWHINDVIWLYVDDRKLRLSIPEGKHWNWSYNNSSDGATINLYTPYGSNVGNEDIVWEGLTNSSYEKYLFPFRGSDVWSPGPTKLPTDNSDINTQTFTIWPYLGNGVGTAIYYVVITTAIERPSITITDPKGDAFRHAQNLEITYYPIIMKDDPAPVAFVINGTDTGLVDHSLDIYDNDPSTVQVAPVTVRPSMTWLQAQKTGHTLEVNLPFLEEDECLPTAQYLYDMYDNFGFKDQTFSLVCGPDDEPKLGHAVDGFDNHLRINEISYSYQDGSSFNVNVSLGPVFTGVGSWNTSIWQKKVEDVSREGVITWCSGDGMTYRVRVRGLGEYYALNASDTGNYAVGEKVSVRIYNNPVEK